MFEGLRSTREYPLEIASSKPDGNCAPFSQIPSPRQFPAKSTAPRRRIRTELIVGWVVCSLLVVLPFLVVEFPPITDLPQHVAQVRLLREAWQGAGAPYTIQWFTPYSLQYFILACAWAVAGPAEAGRLGMLMAGLVWVAAAHLIALHRQRSYAAAALASSLFFTGTTYWGFYGFTLGWPVFALWLLLVSARRRKTASWVDAGLSLGVGVLLYMSHILWLGAAVLWLAVSTVTFRVPIRATVARALGLAPVLAAAGIWYPQLAAGGFTSPTVWMATPTARLSFSWLVNALFGGLRGSTEFGIAAALVLWMILALLQRRDSTHEAGPDCELLAAAAMFCILAFLLPDQRTNTILFAVRWLPIAGVLALLGWPPIRRRAVLAGAAALGVVAALSLATTLTWRQFQQVEMSGLTESLAALPPRPSVIGLDFVKESEFVKGRPFLQTFAYAQVLRGGRLNFSFAEFVPSLVVFRTHDPRRWTPGLEWFPERVRPTDLSHFSHALVNADDVIHDRFLRLPGVQRLTEHGRWRLYRIESER
jgi:hypothetical protein